jgi:hypothetical protein
LTWANAHFSLPDASDVPQCATWLNCVLPSLPAVCEAPSKTTVAVPNTFTP